MQNPGTEGVVTHLNISDGGVPKIPTDQVRIGALGLAGDKHNDTKHHGGPERAVCLYSLDVIERISAEGRPIKPGSTGENVTIRGLDWALVTPGRRLEFAGGVILEVTSFTAPCSTIISSLVGGAICRIHQDDHPGESRVCARVLVEGEASVGESVILTSV